METVSCFETLTGVLKMEGAVSSEMFLSTYQTTRSHNPEDRSVNHVTAGATYLTKRSDAFVYALLSLKS